MGETSYGRSRNLSVNWEFSKITGSWFCLRLRKLNMIFTTNLKGKG